MSYKVLAQKYRPQTFDDVVGQEMVTRTIKNSILNQRLANAYMFSGPRGVGKTSIARLLAKTLNCEAEAKKRPCNVCSSCDEISQGNYIDVLEVDGASNNGVDEIRTLRENVKFTPSKGRFKIYIIDEVHMLSTGAFNALLKTLEEPPAHVKFIFATTEPHKVIPTIMSRCQRFDFKRISPKFIYERLAYIAKEENIELEEKAALLIARSAEGSLRDALVILDQMVSFSGDKVIAEDVVELLGMVHRDSVFELADSVIDNDTQRVACTLDDMINSGKDPVFITGSLISHYRDLMILKTVGSPTSDMALSEEETEKLKQQAEKLPIDEILYILQNLSHCQNLMKGTLFARAPLEITLIRLTRRGYKLDLPDMIKKIEAISKGADLSSAHISGSRPKAAEQKRAEATDSAIERSVGAQAAGAEEEGETEQEDTSRGFDPSKFHWKALLKYVKSQKMSMYTFLAEGRPVELSADNILIEFDKEHEFYKETLETEANREILKEAVEKVTGATPRVKFQIGQTTEEDVKQVEKQEEAKAEAREKMKPVIEQALDVFGGHVVRDITGEGK